jgi:prolyl oligopeptidase
VSIASTCAFGGEGDNGEAAPNLAPRSTAIARCRKARPANQEGVAQWTSAPTSPTQLEQIPVGVFNTEEFGSTVTEEGTLMLSAVDPYHQIGPGVPYPGVLMATGLNDTRVSPWMPAKFAARLQAVTTSSRPVLLRVEQTGGHSFQRKDQLEAALADAFSFLLWQAGVAGFQPPR